MTGNFGANDSDAGLFAYTKNCHKVGVYGHNDCTDQVPIDEGAAGAGVFGMTLVNGGAGVFGANNSNKGGVGVQGNGPEAGVQGWSSNGNGVKALSDNIGIWAQGGQLAGKFVGDVEVTGNVHASIKSSDKVGVYGVNESPDQPSGGGAGGAGVFGLTMGDKAAGVFGTNNGNKGGVGVQGNGPEAGVQGWSPNGNGVKALSDNIGIWAQGGKLAGYFFGDVEVTGDIRLVNADCAEDFDVLEAEHVEPGTVMVINETGALQESRVSYDKRVAGVISGAGNYKPGIVLDKQQSQKKRLPIGLLGKVYCKVDAQYGAIEVGDLLTTSETPGHAMKAVDPQKAFGTVIGKALSGISSGTGLIPILIALQ
ncbi:hypothetical protein [Bacillus sp. Ab-1751]|uniref:hypothetical protein n=1 Tax=Bacillus sp. Ab-1751 TaxID=2608326 RepID=UPI0014212368